MSLKEIRAAYEVVMIDLSQVSSEYQHAVLDLRKGRGTESEDKDLEEYYGRVLKKLNDTYDALKELLRFYETGEFE